MEDERGVRIGSFAGAPIVVDSSIVFLLAYVVGSALLAGGVDSAVEALAFIAILMVAVIIHELAHAGAAATLGVASERIVLTFFGGYVKFATPPRKLWHEIMVSAAGPLANLACWGIAAWLVPEVSFAANSGILFWPWWVAQFAYVSFLLGAFNLLPGFPLDGGHIVRAVLSYFMSRPLASVVAGSIGLVIALALLAFGVWQQMWWTAIMAALLALAAWAEVARGRRAMASAGG